MAAKLEVYKCEKCGNIVEVLHGAKGVLTCCGTAMVLMEENTVDASAEKHTPVVEKADSGVKVSVGSVAHPMQDDHYIEWIEIIDDNETQMKFLYPGETPEAKFTTGGKDIVARSYCNLHGHWKG